MVGIYKITSPSGKVYIGQSWDIVARWTKYSPLPHKKQRHIYNSILKYGVKNHKFEIIHELPKDVVQEVLDNYEVLYWQLYKDCGVQVMNIREPGRGGKNSEETRQKMKENNWNAKHKGELSSSWGKKHTPEHIAASHKKGKENPMYGRYGAKHPRFGKPQPDSFKEVIRRKVINLKTLEIYPSVTLAEIAIGLKPACLRHHLKKSNNIHNMKYLDEHEQNIKNQ